MDKIFDNLKTPKIEKYTINGYKKYNCLHPLYKVDPKNIIAKKTENKIENNKKSFKKFRLNNIFLSNNISLSKKRITIKKNSTYVIGVVKKIHTGK